MGLSYAHLGLQAGQRVTVLSSQPSGESRERIGRYQVLRKIATGGMAELFLARQIGMDGFEKVVAIKRILSHLAHEQEFVQMFQDEARIVAKLHHPNIVQIYDLGKSRDTYFIAMEYIPGRNLSSIAKKAKAKGEALPPAHIAHCISQACEGLYYAHTRHDINGRPLQIVHRDVSPQNIIVAFSGSVKLVDFGIAKAATKIAHTRAGVLKGKYAYMSPEQVRGHRTDARSDLFATGIVLYELLCGRRPFEKENSIQTLKSIVLEEPVPCQELNADIPDPLASIIGRCLEKNPEDRFQSAQEVQLALEEYVSRSPKRINNLVVSQWVSNLFAEELANHHGRVNLPGVGPIVLPDNGPTVPTPSVKSAASADMKASSPTGADSKDGVVESSSANGSPAQASGRRPQQDIELIEGRSDLIEEGIIERNASALSRPTDAGEWAQAPTLNLPADKDGPSMPPVSVLFDRRTTEARKDGPTVPVPMPPAARIQEPIGVPKTRRENPPLDVEDTEPPANGGTVDSGGFMAPLGGGESAFKPGDDPWDEATIGLPDHPEDEHVEEAPPPLRNDPSKGRAHRLQNGVARRRSVATSASIESIPATGASTESAAPAGSNPAEEVIRAAVQAGTSVGADTEWEVPFDETNVATADDENLWDDKTNAEPSIFDEDGVRFFEDDNDLAAMVFDDNIPPGERTIAQGSVQYDPTIVQAPLRHREDDTSDGHADTTFDAKATHGVEKGQQANASAARIRGRSADALSAEVYDEHPGVELTIADSSVQYSDDRTVSYNEEFASFRGNSEAPATPERTAVGVIATDGEVEESVALNDFSTVRSMSDEPSLPVPNIGDDPLAGAQTLAGVTGDFVDPPTEMADAADSEQQPTEAHVSSLEPDTGAERIGVLRLQKQAVADEATTEYGAADADEEATVGVTDPSSNESRPRSPSSAVAAMFDRTAEPVHPSPLDAPAGEGEYISYQDEYSALVGQPKPLQPASPKSTGGRPEPAIGSTNVPQANLTLSQVLAHPSSTPQSRLSAMPKAATVGSPSARAASLRSASMVGRQIREVVRSAESPSVPVRLPAPEPAGPSLDPHGALNAASIDEADLQLKPELQSRRWLGPILAALSILLLAAAVHMALPYVLGPAGPYLRITTTPAGARVLVDGTLQQGETPITISGLEPGGQYRIRVERDGYRPVDRPRVRLPKDGPLVLQIPMESLSSQK